MFLKASTVYRIVVKHEFDIVTRYDLWLSNYANQSRLLDNQVDWKIFIF